MFLRCGYATIGEKAAGIKTATYNKGRKIPDYKNMTATDALRHAWEVSGMTADEIARNAGKGSSVIRRYFERNGDYLPSLEVVPALCRAMNNTVILQWIESQVEKEPQGNGNVQTRADAMTDAARTAAAIGDLQRELAESCDKGIDPLSARDLRGLYNEVIECCRAAKRDLQKWQAPRTGWKLNHWQASRKA